MAKRDMAAEGITPEQLAQSMFRNREAHEIALSRIKAGTHGPLSIDRSQEPEDRRDC